MRLGGICFGLLLWTVAASAGEPSILASYSFDDGLIHTGPDTFAVFQNSKGHVRLTEGIHYSGYRSIELRDVAGDGDFPELQGYFPERRSGQLFFHFSMLVVNPAQRFNIALAGSERFAVAKDGIAFWLKASNGFLHHVSDSIPKKLFRLNAFTWYTVDVRCDIVAGVYDLRIRTEGATELAVDLRDQPNAANAPGSSVDKFSFVGSVFEDDSSVTYYVDDVVIGTDEKLVLAPLIAPGRRKLFVDRWRDAQELMARYPACPPVLAAEDFGLTAADISSLEKANDSKRFSQLLTSDEQPFDVRDLPPELTHAIEPVNAWRSGCQAMKGDANLAASIFSEAAKSYPSAPIFPFSELIALVRANRLAEAEGLWKQLDPLLQDDVRYGMLAAMIGLARGDLSIAEPWLAKEMDRTGHEASTQRYFVLLWQRQYRRAAKFAKAAAKREASEVVCWLQRSGDALLLAGAPSEARIDYEKLLARDPDAYFAATRLADVHFLLGNTSLERRYRQQIYGALDD